MRNTIFACLFLTCWTSFVKCGIISTYGLLTPQHVIVPHGFSHNSVEYVHHPQVYTGFEEEVSVAHPQVIETAHEEALLPNELTKSRKFYSNPYVASALAEESLHFKKEEVAFNRPSEKIDRQQIAKLIHSLDRVHNEAY